MPRVSEPVSSVLLRANKVTLNGSQRCCGALNSDSAEIISGDQIPVTGGGSANDSSRRIKDLDSVLKVTQITSSAGVGPDVIAL